MSFRDQIVVRILLLVARIVAEDRELSAELKALANHIQVNAPKLEAVS